MKAYLDFIYPSRSDPTHSVLKAHFMFEELLRAYLKSTIPHGEVLDEARMSFSQLLTIAKATTSFLKPDDWCWNAISELNKIRNLLAHNPEKSDLQKKIASYISFLTKNLKVDLPEPDQLLHPQVPHVLDPSQPMYLVIDVVTALLFQRISILLGLEAEVSKFMAPL